MEQLTLLDAGFLHAEDADRHTNLGIGGLAILDGPMPDHDELMSTLGERIADCPRFAQRLRRRVFDLSAPQWIDDDNFNLAYHVRRIALPAPGTDDDLFRVVADVMSWRLDRDRPLWEIWVIDRLSDNRWAMLMKVHPCIADGVATVHILTGLSDNAVSGGSTPRPARPRHVGGHLAGVSAPEPAPHGLRLALPDVRRVLWGPAQIAAGTVAGVLQAGQALRGSAEVVADLLRPASSLNGSLTSRRRYSAARVALDDVRQICRTFDVTVNDVALAALTESYRDMLVRRGERPQADSLRTLVPVSTPSPDGDHPTDTRQTVMMPYLPVEEDNPVLRLRMVHARLAGMNATAHHQVGSVVAAATQLLPFPVTAWAMNLLARLPQRSVVALAVNVPGP
ncbi:MAG TPA: wax ester/triacylglycerol synthase family O-acyltransferase, partial [Mycobacterium sp.]|nr:wax ester/triacylglycerol synthase family O-acyltransferase [Mycobacterium sp.]